MAVSGTHLSRQARVHHVLYLSGFIVIILWMNLSRFHDLQYSDSLLLPLTSLQAWTPFYWDQNRFGMLLPLIALPVRDPLANLLVQSGLAIAAGWLTLRLLVEYLMPAEDGEGPFLFGSLLILVALPLTQRFEVFGLSQPYGTSSALTLAGLVVLAGWPGGPPRTGGGLWRLPAAAVLFLIGAYVNVGVLVSIGPLVIAAAVFCPAHTRAGPSRERLRHVGWAIGFLTVSFAVARVAAKWVPVPAAVSTDGVVLKDTAFGLLPIDQWPSAWLQFLTTVHKRLVNESQWEAIVLAALCAGALSLLFPHVRRHAGSRLRAGLTLLAAGTVCFLATGITEHVSVNYSQIRYSVPALMLVTMGVGAVGSCCLLLWPVGWKVPRAMSPAVLLCVVALTYGRPGIGIVRNGLERQTGAISRALVEARVDFVAGDYWTVWPAVFYASELCSQRGVSCHIRGLSLRSTAALSRNPPEPGHEFLVGVRPGDPQALSFIRQWLGPFRVLDERDAGPVRVLLVYIETPHASGP